MISSYGLWFMLAGGVFAVACGFHGAYRWKKPWDGLGGLLAVLGLSGTLIAVLLLHVPDFF